MSFEFLTLSASKLAECQKEQFMAVTKSLLPPLDTGTNLMPDGDYRGIVTRWDEISHKEIMIIAFDQETTRFTVRFALHLDNQKDLPLFRAVKEPWLELTVRSFTPEAILPVRNLIEAYLAKGVVAFLEYCELPQAYVLS